LPLHSGWTDKPMPIVFNGFVAGRAAKGGDVSLPLVDAFAGCQLLEAEFSDEVVFRVFRVAKARINGLEDSFLLPGIVCYELLLHVWSSSSFKKSFFVSG
jgi:hypothetical protein